MNELNERLLTIAQTCKLLGGITRTTLYLWTRAGLLPRFKMGERVVRYRESDVLEYRRGTLECATTQAN